MFAAPGAVIDAIEGRFHGRPILVVGDVMLDRHIFGQVQRISPEAPVPVVRVTRESASPGGAGNVALNLACLGVPVRLVGVVGGDAAGAELIQLLAASGIDGTGIQALPGRPTTTKARIIGGHQQMLRLDTEEVAALSGAELAALREAALAGISGSAAVVISDYMKGVATPELCQEVILACRRLGVPVLIDPKGRDWAKYRGATALKPNRSELSAVASRPLGSLDDLVAEGRRLIRELELEYFIISLSEEGIVRITASDVVRMPAMARQVFDVSGAGDTVLASFAAGLTAGLAPDDALRMANIAAGVVIAKVGTVPITSGELLVEVLADHQLLHGSKICDLQQLMHRVKLWKARGERIVFTNGCFDVLHAGHVSYLEAARAAGDRLLVGLNTDRSVRALKGAGRPINRELDRAQVLSALAAVDSVVLFDEETPLGLITALRPDILVKGADYRPEQVVGAAEVRSWGGELRLMPLVPGLSTTAIAARLQVPR